MNTYDVIIIGGSIAGVSAALTCTARGKSTAVVSNNIATSNLYKAERIDNYPGLSAVTGAELGDILQKQLEESSAEFIHGRALSVMPFGGSFGVAVGNDFYQCSALIIAVGITREKLYPGESEFLGRGVSYCATCDGMLYRGKKVAVIAGGEEAADDIQFLRDIGCEVLEFDGRGKYEIVGTERAEAVIFKGERYDVDAVFIIKDTVSVTKLVPGLEYSAGAIAVDKKMATNIPGVFAAGDCTGKPYQLAKAAGEGNIAALSACDYITNERNH